MTQAHQRFDLLSVLNKAVLDPAGNRLGKIRRLLIDENRGRIDYATLELETRPPNARLQVTVPWSQIQPTKDRGHLEVRIGRATLTSVATNRPAGH